LIGCWALSKLPVTDNRLDEGGSVTTLGHIVYYVRDLETSLKFYHEVVGLDVRGRIFNNQAAILTGGSTHHELLLIQVGDAEGPLHGRRVGLYHAGWKIGDSIDELKKFYNKLLELGYTPDGVSDHTVSQSIYLRDPDGNEVELFVDDPDYDWKNDSRWLDAPVKPLDLS
jgi:catechol 2,3-dioxygenase